MAGPGTWGQEFDEEIADFDVVSPAWDNELDAVADFDAETDADADLNDDTAAAHDGAVGLKYTFDDNNAMYGTLNLGAIDQTSGVISLWFNLNDVALDNTTNMQLIIPYDGSPSSVGLMYLRNDNGTYRVRFDTKEDGGGFDIGTWGTINTGAGWHHILIMFSMSTGVGNDDGFSYVFIDGVATQTKTGIDNDTKDWDNVRIGMNSTSSASFSGSFYIDTIKIDPVGAPFASKLAVKNGTYGLAIPIMNTTARYGQMTDPTTDVIFTAEAQIDPNALTIATNDEFTIIGGDAAADFYVNLKYDGSNYKINATANLDAGSSSTSDYTISDAYTLVRVVWAAATGGGADDGYLELYIDDVLQEALTGLDNDTKNIGNTEYGAVTGLDAGTYGIFYMDDCRWIDNNYWYRLAGTLTTAGTVVKKTKKPLAGTLTAAGTVVKKTSRALAGTLTTAGTLATLFFGFLGEIFFNRTPADSIQYDKAPTEDTQFDRTPSSDAGDE